MMGVAAAQKGDLAGALYNFSGIPAITGALQSSYSGVIDPEQTIGTQFDAATETVIANEWFGTDTEAGKARARLVGGALNFIGDPTMYVGIGALGKAATLAVTGAKAASAASKGSLVAKTSATAASRSAGALKNKPSILKPRQATSADETQFVRSSDGQAVTTGEKFKNIKDVAKADGFFGSLKTMREQIAVAKKEKAIIDSHMETVLKNPTSVGIHDDVLQKRAYYALMEYRDDLYKATSRSTGPELQVPKAIANSNRTFNLEEMSTQKLVQAAMGNQQIKRDKVSMFMPEPDDGVRLRRDPLPLNIVGLNKRTYIKDVSPTLDFLARVGIKGPARRALEAELNWGNHGLQTYGRQMGVIPKYILKPKQANQSTHVLNVGDKLYGRFNEFSHLGRPLGSKFSRTSQVEESPFTATIEKSFLTYGGNRGLFSTIVPHETQHIFDNQLVAAGIEIPGMPISGFKPYNTKNSIMEARGSIAEWNSDRIKGIERPFHNYTAEFTHAGVDNIIDYWHTLSGTGGSKWINSLETQGRAHQITPKLLN
jgi:hypothetical protein